MSKKHKEDFNASEEKTETTGTETAAEQEVQEDTLKAETEVKDSKKKKGKEKTPLEKAEESVANLTDRLMRTAAEFDNFKKRSAREKDEVYGVAVCDSMEKLLPVLDNLERAILASEDSSDVKSVLDGVKMIQKQFVDALAAVGVTPIDAVGTPFDPEKHDAVMTAESDQEENTVLEEFMKGYVYQDKVVRHSMVKVSN